MLHPTVALGLTWQPCTPGSAPPHPSITVQAALAALAQLAAGLLLLSPEPSPCDSLPPAAQLSLVAECSVACRLRGSAGQRLSTPQGGTAAGARADFCIDGQALRLFACSNLGGSQGASAVLLSLDGAAIRRTGCASAPTSDGNLLYRAPDALVNGRASPAVEALQLSRCAQPDSV